MRVSAKCENISEIQRRIAMNEVTPRGGGVAIAQEIFIRNRFPNLEKYFAQC